MFLQNNEQLIARTFSKIGLPQEEINKRISTARALIKVNASDSASSRKNTSGQGAGCAYNSLGDRSYQMPVVVADEMEAENFKQMWAMDADTPVYNLPSSGAPLPALTIWTNQTVKQIFKEITLKELAGDFQQGTFGTRQVMVPTQGGTGFVAPYDDYSMNGDNGYNVDYVVRNIGYFETTVSYGELEMAQWSQAKMDAVGMKREQRDTVTVPQFRNDLGFNGYTAIDKPALYGILNEPNLPPAITLPADGENPTSLTPSTAWMDKDYSQILRDIGLLWQNVLLKGLGTVNLDTKAKLAVPPSVMPALLKITQFGITVREALKQQYPNMEIIATPNFEASLNDSDNTVVMLLLEHPKTKQMPFVELYSTPYMGFRPLVMSSAMSEKVAMGLGGVMLFYPIYVSYAYGV
jgi:hypothetical protein